MTPPLRVGEDINGQHGKPFLDMRGESIWRWGRQTMERRESSSAIKLPPDRPSDSTATPSWLRSAGQRDRGVESGG
jgi:hypothetical protein